MRIDARELKYNLGWLVWHVPLCREVRRVVWVDDETHAVRTIPIPNRAHLSNQYAPGQADSDTAGEQNRPDRPGSRRRSD